MEMERDMKKRYLDVICSIERLNKLLLDAIDTEIEKMGISDINNVQALLIYNIGNKVLTIGELSSRGYYLGTNISYNLKKLVKYGYIEQSTAEFDKRSSFVKLTEKGLKFCKSLDYVFSQHCSIIKSDGIEIERHAKSFRELEVFFGRLVLSSPQNLNQFDKEV